MRRAALTITLTSVVLWALLAVVAVLGGGFGDTHWKILLSSMLVTAAAAVAMACAVPLHAGRLGPIPWAGIGASVVGFGMVILGIWAEESWDGAAKTALSLIIASVAIGLIGLVDGARLRPRQRWVVVVAQALTAVGGILLVAAVWGELGAGWFWRPTTVVLILMSAAVVAVPVLHSMAGFPDGALPAHHHVAHCPFCGEPVEGPLASQLACEACGHHFRVLA